MTSRIGCHH